MRVSGFPFQPKPVQKPHPPLWIGGESPAAIFRYGPARGKVGGRLVSLWIGGESPAAIRRAARLGDGWYPIVNNRNHPLDTPERYAAGVEGLRVACDHAGHDFNRLELGLVVFNYNVGAARRGQAFTGSYADIVDDLKRYRDAGLDHAMIRLARHASLEQTLASMETFADSVMARVD